MMGPVPLASANVDTWLTINAFVITGGFLHCYEEVGNVA